MSLQKKEREGVLRIEETGGASATVILHPNHNAAQLVYVQVPEEERKKKHGSRLLQAAEAEALRRGKERMDAFCLKSIPGMPELLKKRGFEVSEDGKLFSVRTEELLNSKAVKKTMKNQTGRASFVCFDELFYAQKSEIAEILTGFGLVVRSVDMDNYSGVFSGVVYTEEMDLKALILCSEETGALRIELLFGNTRKDPEYIMAALKGMLEALEGEKERFPVIRMAAVNEITEVLLSRVLDKGKTAECEDIILYARKELSGSVCDEEMPETDAIREDRWLSEISEVSDLANISWKAFWYKNLFSRK